VLPPLPAETPAEAPAARSAAPSRPLAPAGRAELPPRRIAPDAGLLQDASRREPEGRAEGRAEGRSEAVRRTPPASHGSQLGQQATNYQL
jgi:hypothetical protein